MEKLLIFVTIFTFYAASCDDFKSHHNIPGSHRSRRSTEPLLVYWNVPSIQCRSKGLPFPDLWERYGIIQNYGDKFQGERVAIMYRTGSFPELRRNGTTLVYHNGGVPQEGDLRRHLIAFKNTLEAEIPVNLTGVGIINFESWRPIFRQNFGTLQEYKDVSYEIEAQRHPWWWKKTWIQEEAERRFEAAASQFMHETLKMARELRPNARWGYYGFPQCFNMSPATMRAQCASKVPEENDRLGWMWQTSTALYPSIYSRKNLTTEELQDMVRGRLAEAKRVRANSSVLPYFWYRYRDGGFMTPRDIKNTLSTIYKSSAAGVILWGSSQDVNTKLKCQNLLDYLEKVLGPAVAKYSKKLRINGSDDAINGTLDVEYEEVLVTSSNTTNITNGPQTQTTNEFNISGLKLPTTNEHENTEDGAALLTSDTAVNNTISNNIEIFESTNETKRRPIQTTNSSTELTNDIPVITHYHHTNENTFVSTEAESSWGLSPKRPSTYKTSTETAFTEEPYSEGSTTKLSSAESSLMEKTPIEVASIERNFTQETFTEGTLTKSSTYENVTLVETIMKIVDMLTSSTDFPTKTSDATSDNVIRYAYSEELNGDESIPTEKSKTNISMTTAQNTTTEHTDISSISSNKATLASNFIPNSTTELTTNTDSAMILSTVSTQTVMELTTVSSTKEDSNWNFEFITPTPTDANKGIDSMIPTTTELSVDVEPIPNPAEPTKENEESLIFDVVQFLWG